MTIPDKTPGQIAYEEDVLRRPTYDSGLPRKPWDKLANWAQTEWEMIGLPVETGRE